VLNSNSEPRKSMMPLVLSMLLKPLLVDVKMLGLLLNLI
jgi:hypothetical protein